MYFLWPYCKAKGSKLDINNLEKVKANNIAKIKVAKVDISLTKLMVSNDLRRSTVTNQIAYDRRDSDSAP